MALRDAILAWIHFMLIFSLAGVLCAELVLYRRTMERAVLGVLRRLDAGYGIIAALIVLSGLARVFYGPKGAAFYAHNPLFWTKMGLFVAVALLSIAPTIHFIGLWTREGSVVSVDGAVYARMRALLVTEAVVLLCIPLFASLMARAIQ